eukprot:TRINITY_DN2095_c0_g1_i5.p1 TRINITY_DN2095_c0_g1~~TRINITY_DN2095_c0_g1_i5.p1  ORF type:complete len:286 (-),score=65.00 TRINITY_DN2095_c0_g1_i5:40-897(-)
MEQAFVLLLIVSAVTAQLSNTDIQTALQLHNNARAAKGVAALTWDAKLATVAQNYANRCDFDHNPNADTDYAAQGGSGSVGENLAAASPTQSVSGGITGWNDELNDWNCGSNTCSDVCGHYTQVVWAASTKVGCGKASCTTNSPFGSFNGGRWEILVCNYNPAGNFGGQRPFPAANCNGVATSTSAPRTSTSTSAVRTSTSAPRTSTSTSAPRTSTSTSAVRTSTSAARTSTSATRTSAVTRTSTSTRTSASSAAVTSTVTAEGTADVVSYAQTLTIVPFLYALL